MATSPKTPPRSENGDALDVALEAVQDDAPLQALHVHQTIEKQLHPSHDSVSPPTPPLSSKPDLADEFDASMEPQSSPKQDKDLSPANSTLDHTISILPNDDAPSLAPDPLLESVAVTTPILPNDSNPLQSRPSSHHSTGSFPPQPLESSSIASTVANPPTKPISTPISTLSNSTIAQQPTTLSTITQRFQSSFGWLSRSSDKKTPTSPPSETASGHVPEPFPEPTEKPPADSGSTPASLEVLHNRLNYLRQQEEAAYTSDRTIETSDSQRVNHPSLDASALQLPSNRSSSIITARSRAASIVDPKLPPGTAAGVAEGPRHAGPVQWDLWEQVITEGPKALDGKTANELSQAIVSGIPYTIRNVIWQFLADSKNEAMESYYFELLSRGAEKEKPGFFANVLSTASNRDSANSLRDERSVQSSASSIRSEKASAGVGSPSLGPTSPGSARDRFSQSQPQPQPQPTKFFAKSADAFQIDRLEKNIRKDMGARTSYYEYIKTSGLEERLFDLCKAYALYDEELGYVQGMNFMATPLILNNMAPEEAFCLYVKLMHKHRMREMYMPDMPGLHRHLYQFERLLEDREPRLYCHLRRRNAIPTKYATQWFLTLFTYKFPLQLALRVYDLIFSSDLTPSILKFALILMQQNKHQLLQMQDEIALLDFLAHNIFNVYIDNTPSSPAIRQSGFFGAASSAVEIEIYRADDLVRDACAIQIDSATLDGYAAEWEEQERERIERATERELLRTQVAQLSSAKRELELRLQEHDELQVKFSQENIQAKLANDELADRNERLEDEKEAFKTRNQYLEQVVESQAQEVKVHMGAQIAELRQHNKAIQESHRVLAEEKTGVDKQLIEVKMKHAQLQENYEDLQHKCAKIAEDVAKFATNLGLPQLDR